jgi:hypothetical protein
MPAGHLFNPTLHTEGCWTGNLVQSSGSEWALFLTNNCTVTPMGSVSAGSICFAVASTQSSFVPLILDNLVGPPAPRHGFGSRVVSIADQPLLEARVGANGQRTLTLFGIPGRTYEIRQAPALTQTWTPGWTNTLSVSLFHTFAITGSLSNAPRLFLRAIEQ